MRILKTMMMRMLKTVLMMMMVATLTMRLDVARAGMLVRVFRKVLWSLWGVPPTNKQWSMSGLSLALSQSEPLKIS